MISYLTTTAPYFLSCALTPTVLWRKHLFLGRLPCWLDSRWAWLRYPISTTLGGQDSYTHTTSLANGAHRSLVHAPWISHLYSTHSQVPGLSHFNLWVWLGVVRLLSVRVRYLYWIDVFYLQTYDNLQSYYTWALRIKRLYWNLKSNSILNGLRICRVKLKLLAYVHRELQPHISSSP